MPRDAFNVVPYMSTHFLSSFFRRRHLEDSYHKLMNKGQDIQTHKFKVSLLYVDIKDLVLHI